MGARQTRYRFLLPLAAVQAVGLACGLIGVRWMSSVTPPELLGVYGLLLSTVQLALVVTHSGFLKHIQRNWTRSTPPPAYARLIGRAALQPTAWMLVGLGIVATLLHTFSAVPLHAAVWLWMAAANLLVAIGIATQSALQAEDRYWGAFASSTVGAVTRSFVPPLLATIAGASLFWLTSGFLFHAVAQAAVGVFLLSRRQAPAGVVEDELAQSLPRMVRAFAGIGICTWLASAAPRWFAAAVLPAEGVGFFVLAASLTLIVPATFGTIAHNFSFPLLFAAARAKAHPRTLRRNTERMLAVVVIGSQLALLALDWLAPWLVGRLIDGRYTGALVWLLPAGGAALAATTTQFYHNLLLAQNREAECLRLSLVSASFQVVALTIVVVTNGAEGLRVVLIALPWATWGLEAAFVSWRGRALKKKVA